MSKPGIYFFIGTTAELIKVFPVMREFDAQDIPYSIISSGQNQISDSELWSLTDKQHNCTYLSNKPIHQSARGLLTWFFLTLLRSIGICQKLFSQHPKNKRIMIVHGDTVSTLMGAILGKVSGASIYHVEAGLRSFNWLKPFPEEICRVIVSRLTSVSFCPNEWAVGNLKGINSRTVNTLHNTLLDSMRHVSSTGADPEILNTLGGRYFIFIMHRQENLFDPEFMDRMLDLIIKKVEK